MQLTQTAADQLQIILTQPEADKISGQLLKVSDRCNRSTLDFAYLTAEAVLSLKNVFKQPDWFLALTSSAPAHSEG